MTLPERHLRIGVLMLALVLLVVAGAALFTASASHVVVDDPDDTRSPLDVRRVEVFGEKKPRWQVVTWPRWTTAGIWDAGYAMIMLDTIAGERADYYVLVGSHGRGLYAALFRDRRTKRDIKIADIRRVGRGDRKSFFVRIPLWRVNIGPNRVFYRWRVQTLFTGEGCRRACFDFAPEVGAIVEPLPIVTPTPTPTPTPTVTPTGSPSPSPSPSPSN